MILKKTALALLLLISLTVWSNATKDDTAGPKVTVDARTTDNPVYAPLPEYPKEALSHHWGGFALYEVHCHWNGTAPYIFTRVSSGHQVLDDAGKAALKQWHWHGGRYRLLAIPMTFHPGKPTHSSSSRKPQQKAKEATLSKKES
jgi:hypothetical protein